MINLKKIPKSLVIGLVFLISLILITYSYKVQNLQRLSLRIEELTQHILASLPDYLEQMDEFIAAPPLLTEKSCALIQKDIDSLQSIQQDALLESQQSMTQFSGYMNDYYQHFQACEPQVKTYVESSEDLKTKWKDLESSSQKLFINCHILSAYIKELNDSLEDGGDMYVNVLFLNMEPMPDLGLHYFSDSSK